MTIDINTIFKGLAASDRGMLLTALQSDYTDRYVEYTPGRFVGVNITQPGFKIEHRQGFWVEGMLTGHTIPFPQRPTPPPPPPTYSAFEPFEGSDDDNQSVRHGTH